MAGFHSPFKDMDLHATVTHTHAKVGALVHDPPGRPFHRKSDGVRRHVRKGAAGPQATRSGETSSKSAGPSTKSSAPRVKRKAANPPARVRRPRPSLSPGFKACWPACHLAASTRSPRPPVASAREPPALLRRRSRLPPRGSARAADAISNAPAKPDRVRPRSRRSAPPLLSQKPPRRHRAGPRARGGQALPAAASSISSGCSRQSASNRAMPSGSSSPPSHAASNSRGARVSMFSLIAPQFSRACTPRAIRGADGNPSSPRNTCALLRGNFPDRKHRRHSAVPPRFASDGRVPRGNPAKPPVRSLRYSRAAR